MPAPGPDPQEHGGRRDRGQQCAHGQARQLLARAEGDADHQGDPRRAGDDGDRARDVLPGHGDQRVRAQMSASCGGRAEEHRRRAGVRAGTVATERPDIGTTLGEWGERKGTQARG